MRKLPPGLCHILAQTRLYTDDREYVIVNIPLEQRDAGAALFAKRATAFSAAVIDKDQLTLVLAADVWDEVKGSVEAVQETPGYRLITFDLPLELGLVGYLATLAQVLAEAGVSIFATSAYQRDHLLVMQSDFDHAWRALSGFIAACKEQEG